MTSTGNDRVCGQCKPTTSTAVVDRTDQQRQYTGIVLAERRANQIQNTVEARRQQRLGPVRQPDLQGTKVFYFGNTGNLNATDSVPGNLRHIKG